jgi:transcriptional regulator with XRE-family HTH domain
MQLERLKEWRESRGLTQKELAGKAGVGEVTVARVETGASVRPNTARKIADALGLAVSALLAHPPTLGAPAAPEAQASPTPEPESPEQPDEERREQELAKVRETLKTVEPIVDPIRQILEDHCARWDKELAAIAAGEMTPGAIAKFFGELCLAGSLVTAARLGEVKVMVRATGIRDPRDIPESFLLLQTVYEERFRRIYATAHEKAEEMRVDAPELPELAPVIDISTGKDVLQAAEDAVQGSAEQTA